MPGLGISLGIPLSRPPGTGGGPALAERYFTITKSGQILAAGSNQYFPSLVDMRAHPTFPYDWALYTSTDHANDGGGIYLWVANGDPSIAANWKSYNTAKAEGGFDSYPFKPAANPIYQDTTEPASPNTGYRQTETPCCVIMGDGETVFMTYHNTGFSVAIGAQIQKTMLATSTDGVNFTRYTAHTGGTSAVVLDPVVTIASGVHTGYFRWGPNPFSGVAYDYVGYSLWYDAENSHSAQWGSDDGITWTLLAIINRERFIAGAPSTAHSNFHSFVAVEPLGDGTYAAISSVATPSFGVGVSLGQLYEFRVAADGLTMLSGARLVLDNGGTDAFDENGFTNPILVDYNGQKILLYGGHNSDGLDKLGTALVSFSAAATPIVDRSPAIDYDTELTQDFRGASAFITGFASAGSSGTATFAANGCTISATASNRRVIYDSRALVAADYDMIEVFVEGMVQSSTQARNLSIGDLIAPASSVNTVGITAYNSIGNLAGVRTVIGGVATVSDDTSSLMFVNGSGTKNSWGIRWFPHLEIAQLLGHSRTVSMQWSTTGLLAAVTTVYPQARHDGTGTTRFEKMTVRTRAHVP